MSLSRPVFKLLSTLILSGTLLSGTSYADSMALDKIVATVDTEVITENELDRRTDTWKKQLAAQGQTVPEPGSKEEIELKKQVLNFLVDERLQLMTAEKYGITVEDQDLNQTINSIAAQNQMDMDAFKEALKSEGMTYEKFQNELRRDLLLSRLQQQMVNSRVVVSDEEVDVFIKTSKHLLTANQEYRARHILISLPEDPSAAEVAAAQKKVEIIRQQLTEGDSFAELATQYSSSSTAVEGGDLGWSKEGELPSLFANVIPKLKINEVAGPIRNDSGLHLVTLSEVRSDDSKQEVQQTHAKHILIRTNEIVNDNEARFRLTELKNRVAEGESFNSLAQTHSEDTVSASKGGDLGWVDINSNYDPTFLKVVQTTPENTVSEPFKSAFGWHIVQVIERRQEDQTEDLQRKAARRMLQNSKFPEERQKWIHELRDTSSIEIKDEKLKDS